MSGSGRVDLPDVRDSREALPDVWEWLRGLLGCSVVVGRPCQMSGCGREAHPDVREWS